MDPRQRFAELIALPDPQIPLAEAALCIAAEGRPHVDVAEQLARLDALAEKVRPHVDMAFGQADRARRLNDALYANEGFRGNEEAYDDPRNSFLDEVLDRRKGIPITLSLVYVEVARRLALDAVGVGFPGHFLAKVTLEDQEVIVDSFRGRILDFEGCSELLTKMAGSTARLSPALLRPAQNREILLRMLSNLKLVYVPQRNFEAALACCERILMLTPDDPLEVRDRGLVYRELDCLAAARSDLEHFLAAVPQHPTADAVRDLLEQMGDETPRFH